MSKDRDRNVARDEGELPYVEMVSLRTLCDAIGRDMTWCREYAAGAGVLIDAWDKRNALMGLPRDHRYWVPTAWKDGKVKLGMEGRKG